MLYDGYDYRQNNKERPVMIEEGSQDKLLIADWLENNLGFRRTAEFWNKHRTDESRMVVVSSAVMNASNRMQPKIDRVQKTVQGESSPT